MHKTVKITGFVDRCKEAGLAVVLKPVDDFGSMEVYFIAPGELILPSSSSKIFEGRLFQFFSSGESDSEKKAKIAIQRRLAMLKQESEL